MTEAAEPSIATLTDALRSGRRQLSLARTTTPGLDAEVLLRHILGLDRTSLFARLPEPMGPEDLVAYSHLLEQRARDIPVAYLTGQREFMGLSIEVGPGVLIPRPETEILVEWAIAWLRNREQVTSVDVGTGSGAMAISIAAAMKPDWRGRMLAVDISAPALSIAARNRARFHLARRVTLIQGSLVSWLSGPVHLIVANLPYLRPDQIAENRSLAAEPHMALDGGADGLDLIRRLLADAPRVLAPEGAIGLEIDPSQREAIVTLARRTFPACEIRVLRDLAGFDRHVTIQTARIQTGA